MSQTRPNESRPALRASDSTMAWAMGAALAAYAGWAARDFLADGLPLFFDAHSHLARAGFVARAFEAGQFPSWTNDWYGGYRMLQFYAPGYYWLTGAVGALTHDVVAATKGVLWTGQVLSALAVFAFCRRVGGDVLAAFAAGVLCVEAAQRTWVLGVVGNHPTLFLYVGAPLLLWHVARCETQHAPWRQLVAGQALLTAVMLTGHLTNTLAILPGLLTFQAFLVWQASSSPRAAAARGGAVLLSLAAAALLTAFVTLPMAGDLGLAVLSLETARWPAPPSDLASLRILTGLAPYAREHSFLASHGGLWSALGVLAAGASLSRRGRPLRPLAAALGVSVASVLLLGDRAALALGFFLFPLCALAVCEVGRAAATVWQPAAWAAPTLGVALAAGWPGVGPDLSARYEPADALAIHRALPATTTHSRTFDATPTRPFLSGFYGQASYSPLVGERRAIPFGAFPQGAPRASLVTVALFGRLAHDLAGSTPRLSDDALDALHLSHVEFLIDRSPDARLDRLVSAPGSGAARSAAVWQLSHATPALFSTRLSRLPPSISGAALGAQPPRLLPLLEALWRDDPLEERRDRALAPLFRTREKRDWSALVPVLRGMGIARAEARAERIFAEGLLPPGSAADEELAPPAPLAGEVATVFAVLEHRERFDRVEIRARSATPGFVRLSYSWDPELHVLLDGQPVASVPDELGGAVVLAFPSGAHRVELRAPDAGPRLGLTLFSAVVAALLAALWLRSATSARSVARA